MRHPRLAEELGDAEVEQLGDGHPVLVEEEEDVLRLEIPVGDAARVRRVEGAGHAAEEGDRLLGGEAPLLLHVGVQGHPVEELHDVVLPSVLERAEREDVDDVAVPDLVDRPRLGDEARHHLRVGRVLPVQDLDRRRLADERVHGPVHRAEASLPQLALDPVLAHHLPDHERPVGRGAGERLVREERLPVGRAGLDVVRVVRSAGRAGRHEDRSKREEMRPEGDYTKGPSCAHCPARYDGPVPRSPVPAALALALVVLLGGPPGRAQDSTDPRS